MLYSLLLAMHLIGVVIGAGAAIVTDTLFFAIVRDRILEKTELKILQFSGRMIWIGLAIMLVTGTGMVLLSQGALLSSSGFLVKMILVGVLVINGVIIHRTHLPFLARLAGTQSIEKKLRTMSLGAFHARSLFISGSISSVTWLSIIVLASTKGYGLTMKPLLAVYMILLAGALAIGQIAVRYFFITKNTETRTSMQRGAGIYLIKILFALCLVGILGFVYGHAFEQDTSLVSLTPKTELVADDGARHIAWAPDVPPPSDYKKQKYYEIHLEVLENVCPLDEENTIRYETWGYRIKGEDHISCGAPGPVLRGRVGDVVRITLTNLPENNHPHNIDFHSVTGQGGGAADLTVAPGETASIEARLLYPGVFMYHCAYGDVPKHIARGMYGMFIVDPEKPLAPVDHEWSVMQSEWYVTEPNDQGIVFDDMQSLSDETPRYITFNGRIGSLTGDNTLTMRVGERARIYFVNEGLNLASNFHPIGSHWDIVYPEGATHASNRTIHGSQSTLVVAGGGTVAELVAYVPSNIILVDHALSRTFYKGAKGIIQVTGEKNHEIFEVITTPSSKDTPSDDSIHAENTSGDTSSVVSVSIPKGAAFPMNKDTAYMPRELVVSPGTTVTWTNNDTVMHTVTSGISDGNTPRPDGKFDSNILKKGEQFSYTFTEPGEYPYFCEPHPFATGMVIVREDV